jgi:uncharacterized membrane protein
MIAIAIVVPILLSLPFFGYMWNLFMHIFGAILFLGNILATAVWASLARRDGRPDILRLASRGIAITDLIFTTPGAILLLLNGGIVGTPYFKTAAPWLLVSIGLFVLTVVLWLAFLVPAQKRLLRLSEQEEIPDEWHVALKAWFRWGGPAALLPIVILVLMVLKPNLW